MRGEGKGRGAGKALGDYHSDVGSRQGPDDHFPVGERRTIYFCHYIPMRESKVAPGNTNVSKNILVIAAFLNRLIL